MSLFPLKGLDFVPTVAIVPTVFGYVKPWEDIRGMSAQTWGIRGQYAGRVAFMGGRAATAIGLQDCNPDGEPFTRQQADCDMYAFSPLPSGRCLQVRPSSDDERTYLSEAWKRQPNRAAAIKKADGKTWFPWVLDGSLGREVKLEVADSGNTPLAVVMGEEVAAANEVLIMKHGIAVAPLIVTKHSLIGQFNVMNDGLSTWSMCTGPLRHGYRQYVDRLTNLGKSSPVYWTVLDFQRAASSNHHQLMKSTAFLFTGSTKEWTTAFLEWLRKLDDELSEYSKASQSTRAAKAVDIMGSKPWYFSSAVPDVRTGSGHLYVPPYFVWCQSFGLKTGEKSAWGHIVAGAAFPCESSKTMTTWERFEAFQQIVPADKLPTVRTTYGGGPRNAIVSFVEYIKNTPSSEKNPYGFALPAADELVTVDGETVTSKWEVHKTSLGLIRKPWAPCPWCKSVTRSIAADAARLMLWTFFDVYVKAVHKVPIIHYCGRCFRLRTNYGRVRVVAYRAKGRGSTRILIATYKRGGEEEEVVRRTPDDCPNYWVDEELLVATDARRILRNYPHHCLGYVELDETRTGKEGLLSFLPWLSNTGRYLHTRPFALPVIRALYKRNGRLLPPLQVATANDRTVISMPCLEEGVKLVGAVEEYNEKHEPQRLERRPR